MVIEGGLHGITLMHHGRSDRERHSCWQIEREDLQRARSTMRANAQPAVFPLDLPQMLKVIDILPREDTTLLPQKDLLRALRLLEDRCHVELMLPARDSVLVEILRSLDGSLIPRSQNAQSATPASGSGIESITAGNVEELSVPAARHTELRYHGNSSCSHPKTQPWRQAMGLLQILRLWT